MNDIKDLKSFIADAKLIIKKRNQEAIQNQILNEIAQEKK